jgi:hypothetical protein
MVVVKVEVNPTSVGEWNRHWYLEKPFATYLFGVWDWIIPVGDDAVTVWREEVVPFVCFPPIARPPAVEVTEVLRVVAVEMALVAEPPTDATPPTFMLDPARPLVPTVTVRTTLKVPAGGLNITMRA